MRKAVERQLVALEARLHRHAAERPYRDDGHGEALHELQRAIEQFHRTGELDARERLEWHHRGANALPPERPDVQATRTHRASAEHTNRGLPLPLRVVDGPDDERRIRPDRSVRIVNARLFDTSVNVCWKLVGGSTFPEPGEGSSLLDRVGLSDDTGTTYYRFAEGIKGGLGGLVGSTRFQPAPLPEAVTLRITAFDQVFDLRLRR